MLLTRFGGEDRSDPRHHPGGSHHLIAACQFAGQVDRLANRGFDFLEDAPDVFFQNVDIIGLFAMDWSIVDT
jgi:hypothetical protein